MKKSLYLTTALVAAGFMAMGSTDVAAAGKKGKMAVTGSYKITAGYAKQQGAFENNQTASDRASYNTFDIKSDSEIHFKASHVTDNGLKVGVAVELETDQSATTNVDRTFVSIGGGFGTVNLGNAGHASTVANAPGTGAVGLTGPDLSLWIVAPAANAMGGAGTNIGAGDHSKITWTSPAISGFTVAADYTPSTTQSANQPINGGNSNVETSIVAGGVKYSGKMGASTLNAGYHTWSTDAGTASVDAWAASTSATFGAFTLGVSYKDVESTGKTALGVSVSQGATSANEEAVAIGGLWTQGKMSVSLGYFNSTKPMSAAVNGDDEATKWVLGTKYNMGPGVDFLGTIANVKWQDEANANTANNNKGIAVIGGVQVAF